jgi:sugar transferase (PEP-CTERM/EpsH1 system associated)
MGESVEGAVKRLRIMHVVHSLGVGGLENGLVNLVNRMDPARFEHSICCVGEAGPMVSRITRPDVRVFALGKGKGGDHALSLKLARLLRKERPDIVHTRNWGAVDGIVAARFARVPVVIHGEHGREAADPEGRNRRRNVARRLLGRWVDRFVTVSNDLRAWLVGDVAIPVGKVSLISNGVDTVRFLPADDGEKGAIRERLGLGLRSFVVGSVGRLDPVKDYGTLIRAFRAVDDEEASLLLVGDGPCRAEWDHLASELGISGRVRILGEREDIPALMRAMDVFVLPSIAEGMSNTILEAMASGVPVLATKVGGNPELVLDGMTGTLFEPQDVDGLGAILEVYRGDRMLRWRHGSAGRDRALSRYSLDVMTRAYEELYFSTAEGRGLRIWANPGSVLDASPPVSLACREKEISA